MKVLKGRTAIARGVIIFSAIVLALALVLPVLADGPNGDGGKPDKSESNGQPAGGGQSGEANRGEAGQVKALPDQASSQGNQGQGQSDQAGSRGKQGQGKAQPDKADSQDHQGQGRSDQADSRGNQGQGKAHPDKAGSQDNQGQGRSDQAGSQGNQGQSKAQPDKAGSQDNQGQSRSEQAGSNGNQGQGKAHPDKAGSQDNRGQGRSDQAGSQGNKGKAKQDSVSSLPSLSQAQSMAQSKQGVDPGRPGLANTQTGPSRLQANRALRPAAAFTPSNEACNLYRSRGKPQSVTFPFSDISQGGSVISISNTGGLKNLRITVNGQRFQVHLGNGAAQTMIDLDVSSALLTSDSNTIEFTPLGKPGTCAMVLLR